MKKIKFLLIMLLLISGCKSHQENSVDLNKEYEYIMYSSTNSSPRSYLVSENQFIDDSIIEIIENTPNVELKPAYYAFAFYNSNLAGNQWQVKKQGEIIASYDSFLNEQNEGLNGYAIVPYTQNTNIEKYITHQYKGEIKEGVIPVYMREYDFLNTLDQEYTDEIIITDNFYIPIYMSGNGYKVKNVRLDMQVIGLVKTYGSSTYGYFYTDEKNIEQLYQQYQESEIKPYNYLLYGKENDIKKLKAKLQSKDPNIRIYKRVIDEFDHIEEALCEEEPSREE